MQRVLKLFKEEETQQFQNVQDKLIVAEERVQKLVAHMLAQAEASGPAIDVKAMLTPAGDLALALLNVATSDDAKDTASCLLDHVGLAEAFLTLKASFTDQFPADGEATKKLEWFREESKTILAFKAKVSSTNVVQSMRDVPGVTALRASAEEFSSELTQTVQTASLAQWESVIQALQGPQEEAEKWKASLTKPSWDEARKAAKPLFEDAFARKLKGHFTTAQKEPWGLGISRPKPNFFSADVCFDRTPPLDTLPL